MQDEKRDARDAKLRAARAARAEAKAGRGTVEDTPEEASKARAQAWLVTTLPKQNTVCRPTIRNRDQ